jgi:NADH-quinone oxidoreductase subunit G
MMTIDDVPVEINGERNILELIRKAGIELPTFCYYSELSI